MIPSGPRRADGITSGPAGVHPHVAALRDRLGQPLILLEVLLERRPTGIELRHFRDATRPDGELVSRPPEALGALAESTEDGAFRPNRSAPTLRSGWRCHIATETDLHEALEQLYPGALADWHAWETGSAGPTPFRDFVVRQTGMYRSTQAITDGEADAVARAGCASSLCLRRRCWSTPGMGPAPRPEFQAEALAIPCLEPCALVVDLARWRVKDQEARPLRLELTAGERESLEMALRNTVDQPPEDLREGSTRHPANPRRLGLLLARLNELGTGGGDLPENKGT